MNSPMSNTAVSSAAAHHSGAASATHNTFRQIGGTLGVAGLGVIVTAGRHGAGGLTATFGTGLDHAMGVVAVLFLICAVIVGTLGRNRSAHGRHSAA
jgi:DHA2 family methylenomycin A resistance protein-like MFS transporter